ncbi:MAG: hypothetical protein AABX59_04015 [Nanoarchaeota archaeon]
MPKRVSKIITSIFELDHKKPGREGERFFMQFSIVQLNAVLLFIFSSSFLINGAPRFIDNIPNSWFLILVLSVALFTISALALTLEGAVTPSSFKRKLNVTSLYTFVLGVILFLFSLVHLIIILI